MGEIRIVGPGNIRGYPSPVCKKDGLQQSHATKEQRSIDVTNLYHKAFAMSRSSGSFEKTVTGKRM